MTIILYLNGKLEYYKIIYSTSKHLITKKTLGDEDDFMARSNDWGGDRRSGTGKKEYGNEYKASDLKDATKYERERYGKREFTHKSPLHPGKGATVVASENLLNQLKDKFGNKTNGSILSEEILIDDKDK